MFDIDGRDPERLTPSSPSNLCDRTPELTATKLDLDPFERSGRGHIGKYR
jgi:hypothetical protein